MNWETELEAIRINASRLSVWPCSKRQAGAIAGRFDKVFAQILEREYGWKGITKGLAREVRIQFLNYLFRDADYGEWRRVQDITSANDLLNGEASALFGIKFFEYDILWHWMEENWEGWRSDRLLAF